MKRNLFLLGISLLLTASLHAQKYSIDKVHSVYLRNSGAIYENNQIKGYYFLYLSDKIDRKTNEYTLQILDQNLNKVKDITFEDSKDLNLLESSYNGGSLGFLFKNMNTKMLEMRIYDFNGAKKFTYTREFDWSTSQWMTMHENAYQANANPTENDNVFNVGSTGYVAVTPLRQGREYTYAVDFFSSRQNKHWTYTPTDGSRWATAQFFGSTDSIVILQVYKRERLLSGSIQSNLVGLNVHTRKKVFEIDYANEEFNFTPITIQADPAKNSIAVMGMYYDKNESVVFGASNGMAVYEIDSKGKILTRAFNDWSEFAKFLPINAKGKIDKQGALFIHQFIKTGDGRTFTVGESFKRGGMASRKATIMDLVLIEFDQQYKIKNTTVYQKTPTQAAIGEAFNPYVMAKLFKAKGLFDYRFYTIDDDNASFSVCYSDYEKSSDYKGETFHAVRYDAGSFSTDRIELKTSASSMRVLPGKPGFVLILEYFKKEKKLEWRLEKLG